MAKSAQSPQQGVCVCPCPSLGPESTGQGLPAGGGAGWPEGQHLSQPRPAKFRLRVPYFMSGFQWQPDRPGCDPGLVLDHGLRLCLPRDPQSAKPAEGETEAVGGSQSFSSLVICVLRYEGAWGGGPTTVSVCRCGGAGREPGCQGS